MKATPTGYERSFRTAVGAVDVRFVVSFDAEL